MWVILSISVPQDLSSLGRSSSLLDKVANLLCEIKSVKPLESRQTIIINELQFITDSVLFVLGKKHVHV